MSVVYILECSDGTYYAGYTNDLGKRIKEHNAGKRGAKYTRGRGPVRVVWVKEYRELKSALRTERTIKALTRKQKELLVNGRRLDKVLAL
ncbi:MAG: GIY-YIG nuclease family protein [Candidatus Omnitrophica bacterium]|nr:GIY-YIG nuclease family protein [Candidatus Omnitrophota bacterium]